MGEGCNIKAGDRIIYRIGTLSLGGTVFSVFTDQKQFCVFTTVGQSNVTLEQIIEHVPMHDQYEV